jgi:predicted ArsR family transcriptional regulator
MDRDDAVAALAAVRDPVRRALYDLISAGTEAVSRDSAAAALGIPRSTAAFHLDQLVAAGLLTVERRRLTGRTGPGAGRPANVYACAPGELAVSLPPRRYDLMAELLATALDEATTARGPVAVRAALRRAGERAGAAAQRSAGSLDAVLTETGYRPRGDAGGTVLANCPFRHLVGGHAELVCGANHAFLCGAAAADGRDPRDVVLDPGPDRCCVRIAG